MLIIQTKKDLEGAKMELKNKLTQLIKEMKDYRTMIEQKELNTSKFLDKALVETIHNKLLNDLNETISLLESDITNEEIYNLGLKAWKEIKATTLKYSLEYQRRGKND